MCDLGDWKETLLNRRGLGVKEEGGKKGLSSQHELGDTVGKGEAVTGLLCVTRAPKERALPQNSQYPGP